MSWIEKIIPSQISTEGAGRKRQVPEGVWGKCDACSAMLYQAEFQRSLNVCPKCGHHGSIPAIERLEKFLDQGTGTRIGENIEPVDALKFKDSKKYKDRLSAAQKATGLNDSVVSIEGQLKGTDLVAAAFEFQFLGGSMGSVAGEIFDLSVQRCIDQRLPFVCFSASGGARMQEALFSLMQMAKTSAALSRLSDQGLPFISVMTNATMGGVAASFASLGDVIVAEPKALIGFAGPRVIEQTVRQTLPEGFQSSEFLLDHGAIDMIVDRRDMRDRIHNLIGLLMQRSASAA